MAKENDTTHNPIQALIDLPPLADLSPDEIVAFIKEMRDGEEKVATDPLTAWFSLPAVEDLSIDEHVKLLKEWR